MTANRLSKKHRAILDQFVSMYRDALATAGVPAERANQLLAGLFEQLAIQQATPFVFEPYHQQITEPFDYYNFGLDFLRPLVNKAASSLRGHEHLDRIAAQLAAGENVVFLANHQSEGDPPAISLLLEDTHPAIGKAMIFVAGERVTTDPLAVPFSMGRNLLCIYSKRYIDNPPEDRHAKQLHNRKTMERMSELFEEGGKCVYVAPSGGRDRANTDGVVEVAAFDPQSVEMMYLMARRAGRPSHFYPMAMATYEFLPPPDTIQAELGEARLIKHAGIHLAIGAELDMEHFPGADSDDKHARREARARHIWQRVCHEYARFPCHS